MGPLDMMSNLDSAALRPEGAKTAGGLTGLSGSFKSSLETGKSVFDGVSGKFDESLARRLDIEDASSLSGLHSTIMDSAKQMLDGTIDSEGRQTLGLREMKEWKLNPDDWNRNVSQQSGYAAEVATTAMENVKAEAEGTGLKTYRADDRPDLGFSKNDQYVDKVRVNEAGEVVERVQTKFVGKDGADWVKKMMDKKFDKYFDGDHVDKLECPKDFFEDAKARIAELIEKNKKQLERTTAEGKTDAAASANRRIEKLTKMDEMIEQSMMTKDGARNARLHPERFVRKLFAKDVLATSAHEGLKSGAFAAGLTFATSSVEHVSQFIDGEISAEEMAGKIAAETGAAGAIGGATSFVSSAVAAGLQSSSCKLISSIGGSCLPAAAVTFCVESYDSVMDFAQGAIEADELAYDLGHNAATVAGGAIAGAKVGAAVGTVAGPVGAAVGGVAGGVVGTVVASGIYETVVDAAPEVAGEVAGKVGDLANSTLEAISDQAPEQLDGARTAFNDFFTSNNIPVSV